MNDSRDSLSRVLRDWRVPTEPDPRFRLGVWQRIQASAGETWSGYVRAHLLRWSIAAVIAMGVAGWSGRAARQARLEAQRGAMVDHYLVGLDPRVQASLRP